MFSKADYMNKVCTHEQYYDQFVDEMVEKLVLDRFGKEKLEQAGEHFNDIPLQKWDMLTPILEMRGMREKLKQHGDYWSLGNGVCILKAAARRIIAGR